MQDSLFTGYYRSDIGILEITCSRIGARSIKFVDSIGERSINGNVVLFECIKQLNEYFHGQRRDFTIPIDYVGSGFQGKIWSYITSIKYGSTMAYSSIADALGSKSMARAVAGAVKSNPIGIMVPCHRVVRLDGSIGGYAWGIKKKEWLLSHEGIII